MKTVDDIFREKPYLFWGISPKAKLSDRSKVCHILNYGDMEDVKILTSDLGIKNVAKIFFQWVDVPRSNYKYKSVNNVFKLYFTKHAA